MHADFNADFNLYDWFKGEEENRRQLRDKTSPDSSAQASVSWDADESLGEYFSAREVVTGG